MMKAIDTTHKLFAPAKAEEVAAAMQSGDEDWTYVVNHDPKGTGYSFISIFDENKEFVGKVC